MLPVVVTIGPVSFAGFLAFTAAVLLAWFLALKIFRPKESVRKDILFYALFLIAAVFVLMLVKKALPLRTYGLMVALGFVFGTLFALGEARRAGIGQNLVMDLSIIALVSGIVGARLFYVIFYDWDFYAANPGKIFAVWEGGLVIYGGIILTALVIILYLRKKNVNLKSLLDIVSMSLLIGIGFGRLGCLGFGCCWGKEHGPAGLLGLVFPKGSPAWQDQLSRRLIGPDSPCALPVWPTQVIESAEAVIIFLALFLIHRRLKKFDGEIVALFFILYGAGRFSVELMRVNPLYGPFSAAQWISLGLAALGLVLFAVLPRPKPAA
jgi:phosphatidylglycerol:prolipoprotein diacylglycerol transferase